MHEMSLAESVREIVEAAARAHQAPRVTAVTLEIGRLAQVELDAMRFAFEVVKRGSLAQDAVLDIVMADASAWCMACSSPVSVQARGEPCPLCGSHQLQVTGGDRMRVLHIEIDPAPVVA